MCVSDQGARYTNVKGGKYTKQLLGRIDLLSAEQPRTWSIAVFSLYEGLSLNCTEILDHNFGE
jgi:hypothetical protein